MVRALRICSGRGVGSTPRRVLSASRPLVKDATTVASPGRSVMASEAIVAPASTGLPDGMDRWPNFRSSRGVLRGLDWIGTAAFAASGCIAAGTAGFNVAGATCIGVITALGGGTLRDVVILNCVPFWAGTKEAGGELEYLWIAAGAAIATFFAVPEVGLSNWDDELPEAVTLGTFAVVGAINGRRAGLAAPLSVLCGTITATGGGIVRDIITKNPIRVWHSHQEAYAETAALGAGAYLLAARVGGPMAIRVGAGLATTCATRYASYTNGLRLPDWYPDDTLEELHGAEVDEPSAVGHEGEEEVDKDEDEIDWLEPSHKHVASPEPQSGTDSTPEYLDGPEPLP